MDVRIEESWKPRLQPQFDSPYFGQLAQFVRQEYASGIIYPAAKNIFRAFDLCPFDKVKVVILGQDPYHEPGQAHGLCFSVGDGVQLPPSLKNIYKEISQELNCPVPETGDLSSWASQGVLLLNATLTVRAGQAGSHQGHGWETFTDAVIETLASQRDGLVFMLWGAYARRKGTLIDHTKHLVLESAHPSPLSAYNGFFGNGHFVKCNQWLEQHGESPIEWIPVNKQAQLF